VELVEVMEKVESEQKNMLMPVWRRRYIRVEAKRIVMLTCCVKPIVE
jgi:hypothetical protein